MHANTFVRGTWVGNPIYHKVHFGCYHYPFLFVLPFPRSHSRHKKTCPTRPPQAAQATTSTSAMPDVFLPGRHHPGGLPAHAICLPAPSGGHDTTPVAVGLHTLHPSVASPAAQAGQFPRSSHVSAHRQGAKSLSAPAAAAVGMSR